MKKKTDSKQSNEDNILAPKNSIMAITWKKIFVWVFHGRIACIRSKFLIKIYDAFWWGSRILILSLDLFFFIFFLASLSLVCTFLIWIWKIIRKRRQSRKEKIIYWEVCLVGSIIMKREWTIDMIRVQNLWASQFLDFYWLKLFCQNY
jgi:hypothetical protein